MAHVVEGSVQKFGNRVKITARLSRAATNEEVWSGGACSASYMVSEWDQAFDFGRRAVALDPVNTDARIILGIAFLHGGRTLEARE